MSGKSHYCKFSQTRYRRQCWKIRKISSGLHFLQTTGVIRTSMLLVSVSVLQSKFSGISQTGGDTACFISNGDGNATSVHIQGATYTLGTG